jgi:hypothetical protein
VSIETPDTKPQARCKHCGFLIYERTPGYWDNVNATEWPCIGYAAHEPEESGA